VVNPLSSEHPLEIAEGRLFHGHLAGSAREVHVVRTAGIRVKAIHDQIYLEVLRARVRVGDDFGISPKPGIGERETGEGLGAPAQQPQNAVGGMGHRGGYRAAGGHEDGVVGFKTIRAVRRAGERADEVLSAAGVAVEESVAGDGLHQIAKRDRIGERQLSESEPPNVYDFRVG